MGTEEHIRVMETEVGLKEEHLFRMVMQNKKEH